MHTQHTHTQHTHSVVPVLSIGTKIIPVPAVFIPVPVLELYITKTGIIILLSSKLEI